MAADLNKGQHKANRKPRVFENSALSKIPKSAVVFSNGESTPMDIQFGNFESDETVSNGDGETVPNQLRSLSQDSLRSEKTCLDEDELKEVKVGAKQKRDADYFKAFGARPKVSHVSGKNGIDKSEKKETKKNKRNRRKEETRRNVPTYKKEEDNTNSENLESDAVGGLVREKRGINNRTDYRRTLPKSIKTVKPEKDKEESDNGKSKRFWDEIVNSGHSLFFSSDEYRGDGDEEKYIPTANSIDISHYLEADANGDDNANETEIILTENDSYDSKQEAEYEENGESRNVEPEYVLEKENRKGRSKAAKRRKLPKERNNNCKSYRSRKDFVKGEQISAQLYSSEHRDDNEKQNISFLDNDGNDDETNEREHILSNKGVAALNIDHISKFKDQDKQSPRPKMLGFPFLRNLIGNDAAFIVVELTKNVSALKDCIIRATKKDDFLKVFVQVIAEGFKSTSTPVLMLRLFETLKEMGFFDALMRYTVDLLIRIESGEAENTDVLEIVQYIISIVTDQTIRNPASFSVFIRIHALLAQVINALERKGMTDVTIVSKFHHLTDYKENVLNNEKLAHSQNSHGTPPNDFRLYPISPSQDEITGALRPFLRQNITDGKYDNLDHYLDIQFRLLREDFVGPLREGMANYINIKTSERGRSRKAERKALRNLDLKIYENVKVHSPVVTMNGLCYKLQLDMTDAMKGIKWKFSKRLIYGSMVCLTDKQFSDFFLATVVEREEHDIKKGFFVVHFENEDLRTDDVLHKTFQMAETTGYFESYRHILSSLQAFKEDDLPFTKYIVECQKSMNPPIYLTQETTYDLRPIVEPSCVLQGDRRLLNLSEKVAKKSEPKANFSPKSNTAQNVPVLQHYRWPSNELLHMDYSQFRAVQTALSNEVAIIQGPPGTGKTYIGLQIVKTLLHNKSTWTGVGQTDCPILIVCHTNHALDQFLEGIVKFFKGDVLRVGGRSNSACLQEYNLKRYKRVHHGAKTVLGRIQIRKRQALKYLEHQTKVVQSWASSIEVLRSEILTEEVLRKEMGEEAYNSLTNGFTGKTNARGFSLMGKWLGLNHVQNECKTDVLRGKERKRVKLITVEADATRQMKERMIDNGDDVAVSARNNGNIMSVKDNSTRSTTNTYDKADGNFVKRYLKHLRATIIAKITDTDIMSENEARIIPDLWRLNHHNKWRLYRMWIRNSCAKIYDNIERTRQSFEESSERYRESLAQEDREIMRQAAIIGMTTSCAARYQSILHDIGPKIIVVEEAAEVLEAHVISTLSKKCEHLILIGDHKQLRPNPTVYKLAVKFKLDVSLFERMVKNEIEFKCLELQHRMRPEISSIMTHIYNDLKDHEDVKSYQNVKGVSKNLFLLNHDYLENSNSDIKSYANEKEAEFAVSFCRFLLLQGYQRQEITLLTTYTGQLMCIRSMMPKEEFEGVKLTVVDNYQGEENKIIILSLVRSNDFGKIGFLATENRICVALSRAKYGLYILGNFDHLAAHSALWKQITTDMKEKGYFGEGLELYCQNHPKDSPILVKNSEDFKKAPEGGCSKKCNARLQCGHKCERYCHMLDQKHITTICHKPCTKTLCDNGHICPDRCYQKCQPCMTLMTKIVPQCGHSQDIPCSTKPENFSCTEPCQIQLSCGHMYQKKCGDKDIGDCLESIQYTWICGHSATIRCCDAGVLSCKAPCGSILKCEHICSGTCGECLKGRVHQPCRNLCDRVLICSHQCRDYCNNCPPCTQRCRNRCVHSKCKKMCGEKCAPCKEPCDWQCAHYKCTKLCSDPCNRPRCNKACDNVLECGHKCIGLCGEPCPPFCRYCNEDRVTDIFFGNEDNPKATFVLLEDCGHIFETRAMDKYMLEVNVDEGIQLKCCPLCKTPIRKCLRYGKIVNRVLKDIERVKKEIIGDFRIFDQVKREIDEMCCGDVTSATIYADVASRKLTQEEAKAKHPNKYYLALCKWNLSVRLEDMRKRRFYTERQLTTIQNQKRISAALIDIIDTLQNIGGGINPKESKSKFKNRFVVCLEDLLQRIIQTKNNLTDQEVEEFMLEIQRGRAGVKFLKLRRDTKSLNISSTAKADMLRIKQIVSQDGKYTALKEGEVQECFERLCKLTKIFYLSLRESERVEIIKAMGLTKGHWFKCPNNHIYAIGECGGATQRGKCPECNAEIGGENHRLTEGNQLAREMDGAKYAAYSEEANNMANFDLNNLH